MTLNTTKLTMAPPSDCGIIDTTPNINIDYHKDKTRTRSCDVFNGQIERKYAYDRRSSFHY
jgi:hypothetical protein